MPTIHTMIRRLIWVCLVAGLGAAAASAQMVEEHAAQSHAATEGRSQQAGAPDLPEAVDIILRQVNAFREQHDLARLETDPRLMATAEDFAKFMARTDRIGHTVDGSRPSTRAQQHGYDFCIIAENIAYQYSSIGFSTDELAGRFVQGWKDSPSHRKNILEPAVTETGIAIVRSDDTDHYYAVQMFGRPRSAMIELTISNHADARVRYSLGGQSFTLPPRYTRTHQQCRQAQLTFDWPGARDATQVQARDGERYSIVQDASGQLALEQE